MAKQLSLSVLTSTTTLHRAETLYSHPPATCFSTSDHHQLQIIAFHSRRGRPQKSESSMSVQVKKRERSGSGSPGVGAVSVSISDAIDDLLRFTLSSALSGDSDFSDLALSSDFCSRLLLDASRTATTTPQFNDNEIGNGVPSYPLYKHLARELGMSFQAGMFPRREDLGTNFPPVECSQNKEIEWDKLISKTGFELITVHVNTLVLVNFSNFLSKTMTPLQLHLAHQ